MDLKDLFNNLDTHKSFNVNHNNYCHKLNKSTEILDYMTKKFDKVLVTQIDPSFPPNELFIKEHIFFVKFVNSLIRYLDGLNLNPKYFWTRSYSHSNFKYNYQLFILCNGHNIMNSRVIIEKSNKLWMKLLKTNITGLINYSFGDNGIMIDRNSPYYVETVEKCITNVSYFAKHRSNEIFPSKIRDFGSSRV